jgi:thymidylate kinase
MIRDADWLASAMYFLSGVIEGARRATAASASAVVLDRSLWSTLAVHYAHDPDRLDVLMPAAELAAARIRLPNLTIVLEASPSTCQARIARKAHGEQALDATTPHGQQFHQREREFYRWLASQAPAVEFVDTEGRDPEEVCEKVVEIVRKRLPC